MQCIKMLRNDFAGRLNFKKTTKNVYLVYS